MRLGMAFSIVACCCPNVLKLGTFCILDFGVLDAQYKTTAIHHSLQVKNAIDSEVVYLILDNMIRMGKTTSRNILRKAIILLMFLAALTLHFHDVSN